MFKFPENVILSTRHKHRISHCNTAFSLLSTHNRHIFRLQLIFELFSYFSIFSLFFFLKENMKAENKTRQQYLQWNSKDFFIPLTLHAVTDISDCATLRVWAHSYTHYYDMGKFCRYPYLSICVLQTHKQHQQILEFTILVIPLLSFVLSMYSYSTNSIIHSLIQQKWPTFFLFLERTTIHLSGLNKSHRKVASMS